jgi:hypothetical protein
LSETSEAGSTLVPDAWIGRAVEVIFVSGSSTEYAHGYLEEVNDRGIVLRVEGHGEYPARGLSSSRGAPCHPNLRGVGRMREAASAP